jgi:hypothetical protein
MKGLRSDAVWLSPFKKISIRQYHLSPVILKRREYVVL